MKAKFHIVKKIVDMEHPKKNSKEEKEVIVGVDEQFELEGGIYVFKLLAARANGAQLEYDRHYTVKEEHRGYEYNAIFYMGEPKIVTSLWGKQQVSFIVTYNGTVADSTTEDEIVEQFFEK
jgi:hypothetical protein